MIIANDVSGTETGFDSEYNAVSIYTRDGKAVHLDVYKRQGREIRQKTDVMMEKDDEI